MATQDILRQPKTAQYFPFSELKFVGAAAFIIIFPDSHPRQVLFVCTALLTLSARQLNTYHDARGSGGLLLLPLFC